MIDTIRFKIPISEGLYELIRRRSIEVSKYNNESEKEVYRILTSHINLGSYDRKVNLFLYEPRFAFLEFSVPKYYRGHNLFMVFTKETIEVVKKVNQHLFEFFGDFPDYKRWEIQRIDLCYAWKFQKDHYAVTALSILKQYNYPKKKKYIYDSALMLKGSTYSIKFYLKEDEFYAHDFNDFKKLGLVDTAYQLLEHSRGILRFEITMREKAIREHFSSAKFTLDDINDTILEEKLKFFFAKFIQQSNPQIMNSQQALDTLKSKYNNTKAMRLWQFYELYHSDNPYKQKLLTENYDRRTIWQNLREISKAGVGLPNNDILPLFDLNIPSKFSVNTASADAEASD